MRDFPNLYLGLAAPSPLSGITESYITWHKIEERNIVAFDRISLNITINFGKFWKSGFFDWRKFPYYLYSNIRNFHSLLRFLQT